MVVFFIVGSTLLAMASDDCQAIVAGNVDPAIKKETTYRYMSIDTHYTLKYYNIIITMNKSVNILILISVNKLAITESHDSY